MSQATSPRKLASGSGGGSGSGSGSGGGGRGRGSGGGGGKNGEKWCLEWVLLERLGAGKRARAFQQFEELSKLYALERPFVARTQVELLFDVYDGRKLRSHIDQEQAQSSESAAWSPDGAQSQSQAHSRTQSQAQFHSQSQSQSHAQSCGARPSRSGAPPTPKETPCGQPGPLATWFRLLGGGAASRRAATGALCCLAASDTLHDLGLVSSSPSLQSLGSPGEGTTRAAAATQLAANCSGCCCATGNQPGVCQASVQLAGQLWGSGERDEPAQRQLKLEAAHLLLGVINKLSQHESNCLLLGPNQLDLLSSGAQLALDSGYNPFDFSQMGSVCLLDRRRLFSGSGTPTCRSSTSGPVGSLWARLHRGGRLALMPADWSAQNGRQWARATARLIHLRRRLRDSSLPRPLISHHQLNWLARRLSKKFWRELELDWRLNCGPNCDQLAAKCSSRSASRQGQLGRGSRLARVCFVSRRDLDQLIELVKTSLNQLIDAQLLLRNKLTSSSGAEQQASSSWQLFRVHDYESLLRDNFNLLKIWQNLEETNKLACFVCEPIKTSLADLFCFNRQRHDWPSSQLAFESSNTNLATSQLFASPLASNPKCLLLVSPLVCLDAGQVKRGLIQILEALNFLHCICKLVHRNLTPRNILIAQQDNWKLSGLEFAIRFESTTISESSSMIAHELNCANTFRFPATSGQNNSGIASSTQHLLRRQRTLHQTKCQEFSRKRSYLLQPDFDYSAPENWRNCKCSHKSDIFSFGLIVAQTYDLCRHKSLIDCRLDTRNYEPELKKLNERKKGRAAQMVPMEMREAFLEMLELEPNLRPSANYLLQLFRRPIELCQANEDSLRHLKSTLNYLATRFSSAPLQQQQQQQLLAAKLCQPAGQLPVNNLQQLTTSGASVGQQQSGALPLPLPLPLPLASGQLANGNQWARPASYFRRVTSQTVRRESSKRQTRSLQLLNLLVAAVDSLAQQASQQRAEAMEQMYSDAAGSNEPAASLLGQLHEPTSTHHSPNRRASFATLWLQFEQTLELLRQVYKSSVVSQWTGSGAPPHIGAGTNGAPSWPSRPLVAGGQTLGAPAPIDTRFLLFIVALHRRLLEQVALMRAELPPLCRPMGVAHGPSSPSNLGPLCNQETGEVNRLVACGANYQSSNHRAFAQAEERFLWLVSKHSLARLADSLAEPMLKLDEFLLVFELLNDLVSFVGQKCKQSFAQRGKQLLNDLTPVTGCPSLSSSDEDYEESGEPVEQLAGLQQAFELEGHTTKTASYLRSQNSRSQLNLSSSGAPNNATSGPQLASPAGAPIGLSRMQADHNQQHRFSDHEAYLKSGGSGGSGGGSGAGGASAGGGLASALAQMQPQAGASGRGAASRPSSRQSFQAPTSINITAPSPMGSVRDMSGRVSADSQASLETQLYAGGQQQLQQGGRRQQAAGRELADLVGQMSVGQPGGAATVAPQEHHQSVAGWPIVQQAQLEGGGAASSGASSEPELQTKTGGAANNDKSHSQLIDELLRTINDDSFNEYIDFNNKLAAATRTQSQQAAHTGPALEGLGQGGEQQQRPRSAIEALGHEPLGLPLASRSQAVSPSGRPRTLNLASMPAGQARSAAGRSSVCLASSSSNYQTHQQQQQQQQGSTLDNVIRRMSTNLVQNITSKIGSTSLAAAASSSNLVQSSGAIHAYGKQANSDLANTNQNAHLRREKSSNSAMGAQASLCGSSVTSGAAAAGQTGYTNSLYVDNQVPARRHSDNTINVPRIQVALSSPQASGSRTNLNQKASVSASKLATKWKTTAKSNQREASDKLSPNLGGALSYMRRHSSGNTTDKNSTNHSDQNVSNGLGAQLLNVSPFKKKQEAKSSSNLGLDFLLSNRSMKRRYSAASMLGHQTQRKAEDLIDAGMKSVQNMFN